MGYGPMTHERISDQRKSGIINFRAIVRSFRAQVLDFLIVFSAYIVVLEVRISSTATASNNYTERLPFIISAALISVLILSVFGVYKRIWKHSSGYEIALLLKATLFSTLVLVPLAALWGRNLMPLSVVILGNLICFVGFAAVRYRSRLVSGLIWRYQALVRNEYPKAAERVLIIGAGDVGQSLAMRLKHRTKHQHYQVVGFVDDDATKVGMYVEGCRVLGTREDIIALAARHNIDLIVVAIRSLSGAELREILHICEQTHALIKVVPDMLVGMNTSAQVMRPIEPEDLIGRRAIERFEGIDFSSITHRKVMVTGAAGSIGSELSRQLCHYDPTHLYLVDNNESALHDLHIDLLSQHPDLHVTPVLLDVTAQAPVTELFDELAPQLVFHVAAYKHVPMLERHPMEAVRNNIHGTLNVVQAAVDHHAERFVLISTDKAVNPSSVMGASKRICELILNAMRHKTCKTIFSSVRFGNVLGSRGSVVPTFKRQLDRGGPLTVTSAEMTRFFMTIPEAANLIIHAAAITEGNDIFILRMGESVRIVELAERMIRLHGLRPYVDIPLEFTGIRPGEKMHEELFYQAEDPLDTQHPDILKVESQRTQVNAEIFWDRIGVLAEKVAEQPAQALDHMLHFIKQVECKGR